MFLRIATLNQALLNESGSNALGGEGMSRSSTITLLLSGKG